MADLNGPKWTSSGQNGPFWSTLVSRVLNPVRNQVILAKMVVWAILDHFGPVHFPTVLRPFPNFAILSLQASRDMKSIAAGPLRRPHVFPSSPVLAKSSPATALLDRTAKREGTQEAQLNATDPIRKFSIDPGSHTDLQNPVEFSSKGKPIRNFSIGPTSSIRTRLRTPFLQTPWTQLCRKAGWHTDAEQLVSLMKPSVQILSPSRPRDNAAPVMSW